MIGYVDEDDLQVYAAARGKTLAVPPVITLQLALDYLELQDWKGEKTDGSQSLQWPRDGSVDVPAAIQNAQLEAALIYDAGGDPIGDVGQRVLSESVAGAVSVTYSDSGRSSTFYSKLAAIIAPYLDTAGSKGGTQFKVSRA